MSMRRRPWAAVVAWGAIGAAFGPVGPTLAQDVQLTDEIRAVCAEAETKFAAQGGSREPGKTTILMYKYRFCPPNVTVKAGTVLRWVNVDPRTSHSVWFKEAGQSESERLFNMETTEFTPSVPGGYPYLCGPHGTEEKMIGHVTVTP